MSCNTPFFDIICKLSAFRVPVVGQASKYARMAERTELLPVSGIPEPS